MAQALLTGLVSDHVISVYEPSQATRDDLKKRFPAVILPDSNADTVKEADVIILAVKPQIMKQVCNETAKNITNLPLIISIAAGVPLSSIMKWMSKELPVVRAMPNTPALVNQAATGVFASPNCTKTHLDQTENVLGSISKQLFWVKSESELDVVTAISGSGPAYFFLLLEIMENTAVELGLERHVARGLAAQTCLGAGVMALSDDPVELRKRVTSPNGTTYAAIQSAESDGVRNLWRTALMAAKNRSEELGRDFD
jgi:pyrroline-5-carboxylate reductase